MVSPSLRRLIVLSLVPAFSADEHDCSAGSYWQAGMIWGGECTECSQGMYV